MKGLKQPEEYILIQKNKKQNLFEMLLSDHVILKMYETSGKKQLILPLYCPSQSKPRIEQVYDSQLPLEVSNSFILYFNQIISSKSVVLKILLIRDTQKIDMNSQTIPQENVKFTTFCIKFLNFMEF